jgi:hypothetical protein
MKKIFLISLGLSIIIITNGQQKKYLDSFLNVLAAQVIVVTFGT